MKSGTLGLLVLLWLLSTVKRSTAASSPSSSRWTPAPLPPSSSAPSTRSGPAPGPLPPPPPPGQPPRRGQAPWWKKATDENLWAAYVGSPSRPGPRLSEDELHEQGPRPITRRLTEFDVWALGPYFPETALRSATLHLGELPAIFRRFALAMTDPRPDHLGEIWFPDVPAIWSLEGLRLLAHEMHHVVQFGSGLDLAEYLKSVLLYGRRGSPIEQDAAAVAERVRRELVKRALEFFANQ